MGLCQFKPDQKQRRIGELVLPWAVKGILTCYVDILTIPYHQWGAALIYFVSQPPASNRGYLETNVGCHFFFPKQTGDDIFNRSIRLLARHLGYSLNQRGLWAGVVRNPRTGEKTTTGEYCLLKQ